MNNPYGKWESENMFNKFKNIPHLEYIDLKVDPIFIIDNINNISKVISQIQSLIKQNKLQSAGLKIPIVETKKYNNPFKESIILVKIENWFISCIPNNLQKEAEIQNYIQKREEKISKQLNKYWYNQNEKIIYDEHSDFGDDFGQYRYLAIDKNYI